MFATRAVFTNNIFHSETSSLSNLFCQKDYYGTVYLEKQTMIKYFYLNIK